MFLGGGEGDEEVLFAVDDERRDIDAEKDVAQRALVGLVEVFAVAEIEQRVVEQSEVWREVVEQPEVEQLGAMDRVVEGVVAEQFEFLHADRREERERQNPLGRRAIQSEGDTSAHAVAEEVGGGDVERSEELIDVVGVAADRVVLDLDRRCAEAGEVGDDDAVLSADLVEELVPGRRGHRAAVEENQHGCVGLVGGDISVGEFDVGDEPALLAIGELACRAAELFADVGDCQQNQVDEEEFPAAGEPPFHGPQFRLMVTCTSSASVRESSGSGR